MSAAANPLFKKSLDSEREVVSGALAAFRVGAVALAHALANFSADFDWAPADPVAVKGKRDPVATFVPSRKSSPAN